MVRVLEDIHDSARERSIPIMNDEGMRFFIDYVTNHDIKNILEIGTAVGYSAISLASIRDNINVVTIERDEDRYNEAIENIKSFNLSNRITAIKGDALEVNIEGEYDLIFIDAAKSQYIKFFEKYKHNLSHDGVIVSDNLSFHGMVDDISLTHNRNTRQLVSKIRQYIAYLENNEEFDTTFYKVGDGVSVSKRKK